jgi:mannose-6-phosphate isomerase-like protein (cupin superfamily)
MKRYNRHRPSTTPLALTLAGMVALSLAGCCSAPPQDPRVRVLTPQGLQATFHWSDEQLARDVAAQPLRVTEHASYSIVRVRTAEKPHVHDHTDLVVTVLSGQVRMHLGEQVVDLGPGDVIDIPRGVMHWAQNMGVEACEAFVVGTPPYNGRDMRETPTAATP